MKRFKKLLAFLMTMILVVSVSIMPAEAATKSSLKTQHPVVFVHGLFGYGDYEDLNKIVPYWGYTSTNIVKYLSGYGTECYSASLGPISSAWDRACELYAQLAGTVVDYGAKHAAEHGHDRYGRDYTKKGYGQLMRTKWSADNPVNLVGHSFGGATSRMLVQLLAEGNAEEQQYMKAHPELGKISPLFTGGKSDWVYSVTTIAAPSNGTTFIEAFPNTIALASTLATTGAKALSLTSYRGVFDFQLEHFGIYAKSTDTLATAINRVFSSDFLEHNDNAFQDLTVDKAIEMNKDLNMQDIYYFSFYGDRMRRSVLTQKYLPTSRMWIGLQPAGLGMGIYSGTTAGGYYDGYGKYKHFVKVTPTSVGTDTTNAKDDNEWRRNDGMVPVMSGKYPYYYDSEGNRIDDPHVAAKIGVTAKTKGVWYVMPVQNFDHLGFCGGFFNESTEVVNNFFNGVIANIVNCGG